jgi:Arc/MetJ-type ribon-helix-helix transcriptional regulator
VDGPLIARKTGVPQDDFGPAWARFPIFQSFAPRLAGHSENLQRTPWPFLNLGDRQTVAPSDLPTLHKSETGAEAAFKGSPLHGMVLGMATTKITITLENNQLEEIRALIAAGAAVSVSAFVKHAVGVALFDAAGWREMLQDALQQTGGPLTKKERTWADALLSPHGQKRVSRKGKAA